MFCVCRSGNLNISGGKKHLSHVVKVAGKVRGVLQCVSHAQTTPSAQDVVLKIPAQVPHLLCSLHHQPAHSAQVI